MSQAYFDLSSPLSVASLLSAAESQDQLGEQQKLSDVTDGYSTEEDSSDGQNEYDKPKKKARQSGERAKRSCLHCRTARRACSNDRPCKRCIARGMADQCIEGNQLPSGRPPRVKSNGHTSRSSSSAVVVRRTESNSLPQQIVKSSEKSQENNVALLAKSSAPSPGSRQLEFNYHENLHTLLHSALNSPPTFIRSMLTQNPPSPPNLSKIFNLDNSYESVGTPLQISSRYDNSFLSTDTLFTDSPSSSSSSDQTSSVDSPFSLTADARNNLHANNSNQSSTESAPPLTKFTTDALTTIPVLSQIDLVNNTVFILANTDYSPMCNARVPIWYTDNSWYLQQTPIIRNLNELITEIITKIAKHFYNPGKYYNLMDANVAVKSDPQFITNIMRIRVIFDELCNTGVFQKAIVERYTPSVPIADDGRVMPTITFDLLYHIIDVNAPMLALLGYSLEYICSEMIMASKLCIKDQMNLGAFIHIISTHLPIIFYELPMTFVTKSGFTLPTRAHVSCIRSVPEGRLSYCVATILPL